MCSRCCIPSASLLVDFGRHVDVRPCCSSKAVILWLEDHKFGSHCARPFVRESLGMTLNHTLPLVCIDWPQGSAAEPCERVCGWVNGTETVKLFRPSKKVVNRDYTPFTILPWCQQWVGPIPCACWQGYSLSPVLFIIIMDRFSWLSQALEDLFCSLQMMLSSQDFQHALGKFAAECEAAGMWVRTTKSETGSWPEKDSLSSPGGLHAPSSGGGV